MVNALLLVYHVLPILQELSEIGPTGKGTLARGVPYVVKNSVP